MVSFTKEKKSFLLYLTNVTYGCHWFVLPFYVTNSKCLLIASSPLVRVMKNKDTMEVTLTYTFLHSGAVKHTRLLSIVKLLQSFFAIVFLTEYRCVSDL